MIERDDAKTRPGLPPRRSRRAMQLLVDIVIPAGTLLRETDTDTYTAAVGIAPGTAGRFVVEVTAGATHTGLAPVETAV